MCDAGCGVEQYALACPRLMCMSPILLSVCLFVCLSIIAFLGVLTVEHMCTRAARPLYAVCACATEKKNDKIATKTYFVRAY